MARSRSGLNGGVACYRKGASRWVCSARAAPASPARHFINTLLSATALAGAGALLSSGPAQAQTQWTGATSTNWFTAGNWNPAAVPGTGTSVQINTTAPNATVVGAAGAIANQLTLGQQCRPKRQSHGKRGNQHAYHFQRHRVFPRSATSETAM